MGLVLVTLVALPMAGCGGSKLNASSSCSTYLRSKQADKDEVIARVAEAQGISDGDLRLVEPNVDYICGGSPDESLGDVVSHSGVGSAMANAQPAAEDGNDASSSDGAGSQAGPSVSVHAEASDAVLEVSLVSVGDNGDGTFPVVVRVTNSGPAALDLRSFNYGNEIIAAMPKRDLAATDPGIYGEDHVECSRAPENATEWRVRRGQCVVNLTHSGDDPVEMIASGATAELTYLVSGVGDEAASSDIHVYVHDHELEGA